MEKQLSFWGNQLAKPLVILISGRAGVGKTTTANIIWNYLKLNTNLRVEQNSFARGVKKCAREFFGWNGLKDYKGRILLQQIGTEIGRNYDPDVWVNYLVNHLELDDLGLPRDVIIIDDWRFPNEYKKLADNPSFQVLAIRIDAPQLESLKGTSEYNHISEIALLNSTQKYDEIINNYGTEEDLEEKIKDLLKRRLLIK